MSLFAAMESVRNRERYRFWLELLLLAGLVFAFRLYVTVPVEGSGDSFVKWYEAKRLAHGLDYSRLDHHTMRWGINFLSLFFQKIFGTRASTYYLPSAFASTLSALFVFLIGTQLQDRLLGIMALILFSLHPAIIGAGSQLFPGIFSICYSLGAVYFLLLYTRIEQGKNFYLVISSLFLLFAYGAKMTSLFFLPAFVLYLVWSTRRLRPVILFLAVLSLGIGLETVIIDTILGDYTMFGRFALAGGHLHIMENGLEGEKTLWGIITRWQMLPNYTYVHTIIGFFAAFFFLCNRERFRRDVLPGLCLYSFAFFLTFALCSLKPVHFLLPHMPRYTNVTIPFSLLLSLSFARKLGKNKYLVCMFFLICLPFIQPFNDLVHSPLHRQFYKIDSFQQKVNRYLNAGYGYIFLDVKHARLYRAVFVSDEAAMGFGRAQPAHIYIVPAGATPYNPNRIMYLLSRQQNTITAGVIRPYPRQYRLAVQKFTGESLSIDPLWQILW